MSCKALPSSWFSHFGISSLRHASCNISCYSGMVVVDIKFDFFPKFFLCISARADFQIQKVFQKENIKHRESCHCVSIHRIFNGAFCGLLHLELSIQEYPFFRITQVSSPRCESRRGAEARIRSHQVASSLAPLQISGRRLYITLLGRSEKIDPQVCRLSSENLWNELTSTIRIICLIPPLFSRTSHYSSLFQRLMSK